jgi:hypothetical protein
MALATCRDGSVGQPDALAEQFRLGAMRTNLPTRTAGRRAEPIGAYATSSDRLPNDCDSMDSLLRATHAAGAVQRGPGRPSRSSHSVELARLCCLHRWPGPASFVQADAETQIWRRCHLIVSFLLERMREKCMELRGFEPLTSCMPCLTVSSGRVALGRITTGREDIGV